MQEKDKEILIIDVRDPRGLRLKLEPNAELLAALQDMGQGTKALSEDVRAMQQVETSTIYLSGYKDGLLSSGIAAALFGLLIFALARRKA